MIKRGRSILLSVFLWVAFSSLSQADSPYFGQSETIDHQNFGSVEIAVLYGDGILSANPARVVVFDSDGYLLAASPQSLALLIRCAGSGSLTKCQVYDELSGDLYEPDATKWVRGKQIVAEGRPNGDAYPELLNVENGFTVRPATFKEKLTFEIFGIISSPILSALSVMWWTLAWWVLLRPVWRWQRYQWRLKPLKVFPILLGIVCGLTFAIMTLLAAYGWSLAPYSRYFFLFSFTLGAVLALALPRTRTVSQIAKSGNRST